MAVSPANMDIETVCALAVPEMVVATPAVLVVFSRSRTSLFIAVEVPSVCSVKKVVVPVATSVPFTTDWLV